MKFISRHGNKIHFRREITVRLPDDEKSEEFAKAYARCLRRSFTIQPANRGGDAMTQEPRVERRSRVLVEVRREADRVRMIEQGDGTRGGPQYRRLHDLSWNLRQIIKDLPMGGAVTLEAAVDRNGRFSFPGNRHAKD